MTVFDDVADYVRMRPNQRMSVEIERDGAVRALDITAVAVSYTHLDVYKRQSMNWLKPASGCASSAIIARFRPTSSP